LIFSAFSRMPRRRRRATPATPATHFVFRYIGDVILLMKDRDAFAAAQREDARRRCRQPPPAAPPTSTPPPPRLICVATPASRRNSAARVCTASAVIFARHAARRCTQTARAPFAAVAHAVQLCAAAPPHAGVRDFEPQCRACHCAAVIPPPGLPTRRAMSAARMRARFSLLLSPHERCASPTIRRAREYRYHALRRRAAVARMRPPATPTVAPRVCPRRRALIAFAIAAAFDAAAAAIIYAISIFFFFAASPRLRHFIIFLLPIRHVHAFSSLSPLLPFHAASMLRHYFTLLFHLFTPFSFFIAFSCLPFRYFHYLRFHIA